tara:strand:+ start:360 stop:596 length:237 start_codon:yes stop_codon:yes gene_type:complete
VDWILQIVNHVQRESFPVWIFSGFGSLNSSDVVVDISDKGGMDLNSVSQFVLGIQLLDALELDVRAVIDKVSLNGDCA